MTETRPTQADHADAAQRAQFYASLTSPPYGPENPVFNLARCYLALAAENKALEERVRRLRIAIREDLFTDEALHNDDLLAADDAKAAGEPVVKIYESVSHGQGALPATDNRASRRREYVRDKAPVLMAGMLACTDSGWTFEGMREEVINQAGLIFDETEQGE